MLVVHLQSADTGRYPKKTVTQGHRVEAFNPIAGRRAQSCELSCRGWHCDHRFDADQPDKEPSTFRRIQLKAAFSPDDFETKQVPFQNVSFGSPRHLRMWSWSSMIMSAGLYKRRQYLVVLHRLTLDIQVAQTGLSALLWANPWAAAAFS